IYSDLSFRAALQTPLISKMTAATSGSEHAMRSKIHLQMQVIDSRREDLEVMKRAVLTELSFSLPALVDFRVREILVLNPQLLNTSEEAVLTLKAELAGAKRQAVARVMQELADSPAWYECGSCDSMREKNRLDSGGSLFNIIQHIEDEFLPVFDKADIKRKYRSGKTDICPVNLSSLPSVKLVGLAGSYEQFMTNYCEAAETLRDLKKNEK
ncbi:MAG TPA: hypothetical protein VFA15_03305, partial [Nitrososphaera sp.]|nr:hypothetical protein [Nitrososphaera sp.]